jgi:GTP pyrophosphokinase
MDSEPYLQCLYKAQSLNTSPQHLELVCLQMVIQELPPGSTVADLMSTRKSDIESLAVSSRRPSRKEARVKVNHQFVDTFQQKLRMGDLVEVTMVVVTSQPSPVQTTSGEEQRCGKIALEFQREQLKRLYLDGGDCSGETRRSTPLERSPSVAGLT